MSQNLGSLHLHFPAANGIQVSHRLDLRDRRCSFMATALYTRRGYRQIREFAVEVFEISSLSLRLRSPFATILPDDFTLILGARQHGMGCSVVDRFRNTIRCNLIRRETADMVSYLSSLRNPQATLEEIQDPLFPRSMILLRR